ncbi:MAG TPA: isoaspartyl peptidase/L-asparaginase [Nannocystaceae bacterium]|nr:isoaspartyl peptidase/L-asparaginase [Nannocystaceae bacterium]
MDPVIVVHGGAGRVAPEHVEAAQAGVRAAAEAGRAVLLAGGDAIAAVIAAVRVLEDEPNFNAGRGACFNFDGIVEVDAGIMRGRDRGVGAIAAVPELGDAITVAHAVLEHSPHCLLSGAGAVRFAKAHGVGNFGRDAVWTAKAQARWEAARAGRQRADGQADTVGAIAIDENGELASACSTGGTLLKHPGRVGDSPVPGAGYWAQTGLGAACATGTGEAILRTAACHAAMARVAAGMDPEAAARAACDDAVSLGPELTCGLIVLDAQGRIGVAHRSEHMSHAWAKGAAPVHAALSIG